MSSINRVKSICTHEGARAKHIEPYQQLRRSVAACLLWEDQFYESGEDIAARIRRLASELPVEQVSALAVEARERLHLRHAPLLLALAMLPKGGKIVGRTISRVIQRPDELTELLALYWQRGKVPLSNQLKLGLAGAFTKFDEYQLAKYNRSKAVKLRDVLFLCHAKPKNPEQEKVWKKLANGALAPADTWEVALSGGSDKKETFTRLLTRNKLGYLALLRNLRNMREAGVDPAIVRAALDRGAAKSRALPLRFISAMQACPGWEPMIDDAMRAACAGLPRLKGDTAIVVDCSGSMIWPLSGKSRMTRFHAAAALAIQIREIAEDCSVYAFGTDVKLVPARRGMALAEAIVRANVGGGTRLGNAVKAARNHGRVIVITDEQSHDSVPDPLGRGYVINVASYKNGVGYGAWNHIDGFSESVIDWIKEYEGD